jgi:phage tail-like protein
MRRDDWLTHLLPVGMAEDDFLFRFVSIFQRVADTVVHQIDTLPHTFDPTVAPEPMVRLMGAWMGVEWIDSSLEVRLQRAIVTEYSQIIRWRGTKLGVRRLLELLSGGGAVTVSDSGGVWPEGESPHGAAHVRIDLESTGWLSDGDLVRIVRAELPATASFDLWVAGVRVYPTDDPRAGTDSGVGRLPTPVPSPTPAGGPHG